MSCGKQRFSEVMDHVFGTGVDAASTLYQSIVDDFAASGLAMPSKDDAATPETAKAWVEHWLGYSKKIQYGTLFKGLLKGAVAATVGYMVVDAIASLSTAAVVLLGEIIAVLVLLAAACFAVAFLIEVLKSELENATKSLDAF